MTAAERVRAPRLRPGDRVAVVAPSGPLAPERLDRGLDVLRGWDLDPVAAPHARGTHPTLRYLAAADEERARDLQEAWCDPGVKAVFAARGGYGAQRMVDLLDWDAVRAAAPKPLVGFSDVTVLHEAFAVRAGVSTLHGPAVAGEVFLKDDATREHLRRTLFAPETVRTLASPTARPLVPGQARGVTLGGCLTMLATEVGTPRARRGAAGGLLLLEDIGEPPYRIDRALTQLLRAGWLDGAAGIVLGSWAGCGPYDRVREVLVDRLGGLGVPVAEEFGFGHGDSALTLPLGVPAELDATAGTLAFERPATV
ncbi:LD-carboxypeptidase [Streptomyces sp. DSM 41527]|uniref:LD-carboxypeptidase n=1 Tax=Streptomyces mooreae TaxID=3075523 RepID=A0ABU2SZM6_9ACTN|nr:LD-carboxypeptidase [Streptomyces sp. DSM 41527]MDT0454312.1 LD-carboxypeptidase [Streptomyces sp. DSM 41527]